MKKKYLSKKIYIKNMNIKVTNNMTTYHERVAIALRLTP